MKKSLLQQFEDHLRSQNLRLTDQRKLIVNSFARKKGHVSAEDLYRHIHKTTPSIGAATVYRTLKLLADAGLASGKNFGDGYVRFECCLQRSAHHDHLICTRCGKIVEFSNSTIEKLQETVARDHGFLITDHSLDIYGVCQDCSVKQ
ncbi:MAG: transcriptional repressor [Desulfobulbaceae bacterium]|uniref:Ferric uptake regulation protein n=1 Tax=Candidatus Desulfobia pelagia TaxID=2841692 RepID=A0A8J6NDY8_9BACT|nr:transcriptional repressor [Candidatus Desulfobia pelagia]